MNERVTMTYNELLTEELSAATLTTEDEFHALVPQSDPLVNVLTQSGNALLEKQADEGYWQFVLEADTTIPAEYIMLQHYLGNVDEDRQRRLADYILEKQLDDGSWPLYEGGPGNISASVKSYLALKLAGHSAEDEALTRARTWILKHGGAENSNVFTRITLAMFNQLPWCTVPAMPAECIWLPTWWVFNLSKVSYWSRCVIVPLLIIFAKRPVHRLKPEHNISELFLTDPHSLRHIDSFSRGNYLKNAFIFVDRCIKLAESFIPGPIRRASLRKCERWTRDHMRGEGGIGAIYPAMANAVIALKLLGNDASDPDMARGLQAIEDLVMDDNGKTYVQPCVSPIWDTCLSVSALSEAGLPTDHEALQPALDWLFDKQIFIRGDWSDKAPRLDSGGWAFQFENDLYPDIDDTSMVVMALLRAGAHKHPAKRKRIAQAVNWVLGMQNSDGGWGAFDIDNHYEYLNNIPFADHGALVDPSTPDLGGRCVEMLAMLGYDRDFPPVARALDYLRNSQEECGAWYGRWGVNYIYGTWAVLVGLGALGEDPSQPWIRRAMEWLKSVQNSDGGWGEGCDSYDDPSLKGMAESTPSQTAWALLGLMSCGEYESDSVERGIQYLIRNAESGGWKEPDYTGTGFPRVFYLRYHGYSHYFPLWALGVYQRMKRGIPTRQLAVRNEGPVDLGPLPALNA